MPFSHDIAGGQGNLIATSVQSPNFVHGVSGWRISKDGTAEFHSIILPNGQGVSVFFQGTPPVTTHIGDLWYDTGNGLLLHRWDGSTWVAQQIGTGAIANQAVTGSLIANATITGTQLASSVTARSLGGITTTISATAPSSPATGDLWLDQISAGPPASYLIKQWNGSAWVPLTANATDIINASTITGGLVAAATITGGNIAAGTVTATNIAANTITATQLAAGIIYAGIVNGTTITGATIVADGASGQMLVYTGTPAAGNLIASVSGAAGTDSHGNAYQAGVYAYGPSGSYIGMTNDGSFASLQLFPPGPLTHNTTVPNLAAKALNAGAVNEQAFTVMSSGKESSNADAALQLFSVSANGANAASATFEFGGTIAATITRTLMTLTGISQVISGQATPSISLQPNNSHVSNPAEYFSSVLNNGAVNEQLLTVLTSGKENSHDDAAIQLFSASNDNTLNANLTIEFGGIVFCSFTKTGMVLPGGSTPPAVSSSASLYGTTIGGLQVVDGADLQAYGTQRRTLILSSNTNLAASPSATTIFSTQVAVRSYLIEGTALVSVVNLAQQLSINIAPPAGTGHANTSLARAGVIIATDFNLNSLTALGAAGSLSAGQTWVCRFQTIINVTGAGTLNIQFAATNASDISVLANSWVSIMPV